MNAADQRVPCGRYVKPDGLGIEFAWSADGNLTLRLDGDSAYCACQVAEGGRSFTVDWKYGKATPFVIESDDVVVERNNFRFTRDQASKRPRRVAEPPAVQLLGFAEQGFMHLRSVLPPAAVAAALAAPDIARLMSDAMAAGTWKEAYIRDAAVLSLLTFVEPLIEGILGCGAHPQTGVQVAAKPRVAASDLAVPPTWEMHGTSIENSRHIDGLFAPGNGVAEGAVSAFTMLVGFALTDAPRDWCGNFTVWPSSHRQLASRLRRDDACFDALKCRASTGQNVFHAMNAVLPSHEMHPPVQLHVNAGDCYIAFPGTVHAVAPNIVGEDTRLAVYFRVVSKGRRSVSSVEEVNALSKEVLSDVLHEMPPLQQLVTNARGPGLL